MIASQEIKNFIIDARQEKIFEILSKTKNKYTYMPEVIEKYEKPMDISDVKIIDGEVLTYLDGYKYPVRGFPDEGTLITTTIYKRFLPLFAKNIKNQNIFLKIITLLSLKFNADIFINWVEMLLASGQYLLKEEYYSNPIKEIRKVLKNYLDIRLVNAIALVFEYDHAYKYRMQDIIPYINKSKLTGYFSTIKEILRVCNIYIEKDKGMIEKMSNIKMVIRIALLLPSINKTIREILKELDFNKIKLNKYDTFWVKQRRDYKFNI